MNIRKKEMYYFICILNEVFDSNDLGEKNAKVHLTREFPECFRITFYCGEKAMTTKHIFFHTNFSLGTLTRIVLREFPNIKHAKKRKDRCNNPSVAFTS